MLFHAEARESRGWIVEAEASESVMQDAGARKGQAYRNADSRETVAPLREAGQVVASSRVAV
ncbi:hypothetical protein IMZ48_32245 [Candidatus Bathyarchaeota archaeon]|nr:hypothetical protein [Candidatus Bathyarchaeota archaeon]